MTNQIGVQIEYLKKFGLDKEEAEIYLHLLSHGKKTVSELRKDWRSGSNKVLSILQSLKNKNLIKEIRTETGRFISANEPIVIANLIEKQKREVELIRDNFNLDIEKLEKISANFDKHSKILRYYGIEGLKQVMWHSADAEGILRLSSISKFDEILDYGFYEKVRERYVDNCVQTLELSNLSKQGAYTNIHSFVKNWQMRYISPKVMTFQIESLIYNDVYTLYNRDNEGIFCIEIHNQLLANMQKQLFDFIWNRAQKMKVIDPLTGEAVIDDTKE